MKQDFEHKIIKSVLEKANIPFKNRDIINIETDADGIHFCLKGKTEHYFIQMHNMHEQSESSWVKYSLYEDDTIIVNNGSYLIEAGDRNSSKNFKKWLIAGFGFAAATAVIAYKVAKGKEIKEPTSVYDYTQKYLDSLDLEKLDAAYDFVHSEYMNPNRINERFDDLDAMLRYIKKRKRIVKYGDNPPIGFPVHREHAGLIKFD